MVSEIRRAMDDWQKTLYPELSTEDAYDAATESLSKIKVTRSTLDDVIKHIQDEITPDWSHNAEITGVDFKKYGLFISAVVNKIIEENETIIVPIRKIDDRLLEKKGIDWFKLYSDLGLLDHLGYCHKKGKVVYDGNAGNDFAYGTNTRVVLTGKALNRAGKRQKHGTIVIFGSIGEKGNEEQESGRMLVCLDAGNAINLNKKGGDTYVLQSVGNDAANNMKAGNLFVFKNAGENYANGMGKDAHIYIGGRAGEYRGEIGHKNIRHKVPPHRIATAINLRKHTISFLHGLGISPVYHRND